MRSIGEVRAAKLTELQSIIARPSMWAADGRAMQTVATGALSDLCFIDDRDNDYTRAMQSLYLYGKFGVVGAFRAVFGDECGYVAEVASVFAQLAVGCRYVYPESRLSDDGWSALHGEVLDRYGERDVRLSEVRKDLGPSSLLIDWARRSAGAAAGAYGAKRAVTIGHRTVSSSSCGRSKTAIRLSRSASGVPGPDLMTAARG